MNARPLASVSLDLDDQWTYMKTHGDPAWTSFPSYLDVFVPRVLGALDVLGLRITFFVVGQDAALPRNHETLRAICDRGHEVGNHSFTHEQGIEFFSRERVRREVQETTEAITRATGQEPKGYRGPGFSWNRDLLEILAEGGYVYDASTLPTYIGPLARFYYFRTASITREEMEQRRNLFGGFRDGFRPINPYRWNLGPERSLLEIPVTTIPGIKTPFHLSYLLYLSRYSSWLMSAYLDTALALCRITGTEPSFLLHPLDLIGPDQAPELAFFPGMDLSAAHKMRVFHRVLGEMAKRFTIVTMSEHARQIAYRNPPLRNVDKPRQDEAAA